MSPKESNIDLKKVSKFKLALIFILIGLIGFFIFVIIGSRPANYLQGICNVQTPYLDCNGTELWLASLGLTGSAFGVQPLYKKLVKWALWQIMLAVGVVGGMITLGWYIAKTSYEHGNQTK